MATPLIFRIPVRPIFIRVTPCFQVRWWALLTTTFRLGCGGVLHTTGVFILPKAAEAVTVGQKLYLADGKLITEAGEEAAPNPLAGTAWAEAAADADSVPVRLGY